MTELPPEARDQHHLIVGDGVIGRATAQALLARGQPVVLASRRPPAPGDGDVSRLSLDALDNTALRAAAKGASHFAQIPWNRPFHSLLYSIFSHYAKGFYKKNERNLAS